jgi:adenylyltransferase/sulfurtransferase
MYLASTGIGHITIVDPDVIELSNLHRQLLFREQDIGEKKAQVAAQQIRLINSQCIVSVVEEIPDDETLRELITQADVVIEGTDNFESRYRHNQACMDACTPLVSGAVIRFEGQVTCFDFRLDTTPCYACLYANANDEHLNCSENGVLPSVVAMIASTMVTESVKLIAQIGDSLVGRLLLLDAMSMEWRSINYSKDEHCSTCSAMRSTVSSINQ